MASLRKLHEHHGVQTKEPQTSQEPQLSTKDWARDTPDGLSKRSVFVILCGVKLYRGANLHSPLSSSQHNSKKPVRCRARTMKRERRNALKRLGDLDDVLKSTKKGVTKSSPWRGLYPNLAGRSL